MRKKLFIFTLLIVGLVSCDVNSKLLVEGAIRDVAGDVGSGVQRDEGSKSIINNGDFSEEVVSSGVINSVQSDEAVKPKEDEINKVPVAEVIKVDVAIKDEKEELISAIKKDVNNVKALVSADKAEVEDIDQYGMKEKVFKAVLNKSNQKTLDDNSNKELRRLFYSSLLYNKERIKEFAGILKKIESDVKNRGTWIIDIMNAVIEPLQFSFERVINKLEENKDKLDKLSLDDLREVKSKLEEIQLQRLTWRKSVDAIITDYKGKKDGIDSDSEKLISHISEGYKNLITVKIPRMKEVSDKIISLIDKIK
ncbi:complement regulator-acquiring protein [Borrelia coriaceae]|uniref:complement regulator-acquiring protein n=1 Tax=Borrelia coriaceae TaxID=144 RepID=UPI00047FF350|nr:complement regulator-acquiring protein [Borrelia coriaceae]